MFSFSWTDFFTSFSVFILFWLISWLLIWLFSLTSFSIFSFFSFSFCSFFCLIISFSFSIFCLFSWVVFSVLRFLFCLFGFFLGLALRRFFCISFFNLCAFSCFSFSFFRSFSDICCISDFQFCDEFWLRTDSLSGKLCFIIKRQITAINITIKIGYLLEHFFTFVFPNLINDFTISTYCSLCSGRDVLKFNFSVSSQLLACVFSTSIQFWYYIIFFNVSLIYKLFNLILRFL